MNWSARNEKEIWPEPESCDTASFQVLCSSQTADNNIKYYFFSLYNFEELEKKIPKEGEKHQGKDGDEEDDVPMLSDAVTPNDIANVVSRATGIPILALVRGEKEKLLTIEEKLGERVVGQTEAVKAVSDAIRLSRAGESCFHVSSNPLLNKFPFGRSQ